MLRQILHTIQQMISPTIMNKNRKYRKYDIGDYSYGWPKILFDDGRSKLKIGKFCSISKGVVIFLGGNHHTHWVSTYAFAELIPEARGYNAQACSKGDVTIGNDVWIGQDVMILSGVTIGNGAVIAARSVVSKDVEDFAVIGGVPAKRIRYRFSEEEIAALQKIAWWDWPLDKIVEALPLLLSPNINDFIARYSKQPVP